MKIEIIVSTAYKSRDEINDILEQVRSILDKFNRQAIVVGYTLND